MASLGTLISSGNANGDGDAETCEKIGGENATVTESNAVGNHSFCTFKLIDITDIRPLFTRTNSCKEVRNQLLISHDEDALNDRELLLLCDLNQSNIFSTYLLIPFLILTSMIWR